MRKYLVIIGDGMSDYPLTDLNGKTPLETAQTPNMDYIARNGAMGLARTIPENFPPGSDVANLSILGYDPSKYYTGRGPLEALAEGIPAGRNDMVFRANLVYVKDGLMVDYSGGQISGEEAIRVIEKLRRYMPENVELFPGVGYRNLLVLRNITGSVETHPPHDILGKKIDEHLPAGNREIVELLREIIRISSEAIPEVTEKANMLWPWGGGTIPDLPAFREMWGVSGGVISAVDLIKGIARGAGMEVIDVPGATGYIDTDLESKADYALRSLEKLDLIYIHVEGIDEVSHEGDVESKVRAIEEFDERLVGRLIERISDEVKILLMPDHSTPVPVRTHTRDPVPFAIFGVEKDGTSEFTENEAEKGKFGLVEALSLFKLLIR